MFNRKAKQTVLACLIGLGCLISTASAHYLWVAVDAKTGSHGTANIYFEEGPAPGDGHYLDPFVQRGKTWTRTVESPKPKLLKMSETKKPGKRWLSAELPVAGPRSIDSYGKYGVYRYGKTDVQLHYYSRHLDVRNHEDLHALARAEQMEVDIVPHETEDGLELTVLWKGKPAANRPIYIRGPKKFRLNTKTDDKGTVRFPTKDAGQYLLRSYVEENKGGTDPHDGKEYQLIRRHAMMTLRLPIGG